MRCECGEVLTRKGVVEECVSGSLFARFDCLQCGSLFGVEGDLKELEPLVDQRVWTDEAQYQMSRLPFYLAPLVREEVQGFADEQGQKIVTAGRMEMARNKGMVTWSHDAEQRLSNVPSGIRAMAKTELERTALDRGMKEVTVQLMEEVKARYFGMALNPSSASFD